jgi:hypothetical protein
VPLRRSESVDQLSPRGFSKSPVYRKLLVGVSEIVQDSCPGAVADFGRSSLPRSSWCRSLPAGRDFGSCRDLCACQPTNRGCLPPWITQGSLCAENPARQAGPAKRSPNGSKGFLSQASGQQSLLVDDSLPDARIFNCGPFNGGIQSTHRAPNSRNSIRRSVIWRPR